MYVCMYRHTHIKVYCLLTGINVSQMKFGKANVKIRRDLVSGLVKTTSSHSVNS